MESNGAQIRSQNLMCPLLKNLKRNNIWYTAENVQVNLWKLYTELYIYQKQMWVWILWIFKKTQPQTGKWFIANLLWNHVWHDNHTKQ